MIKYTFAMGGEAGYGINSTCLRISKIASRLGYDIFNYFEYPSVVRGGHTLFRSTFSSEKVYSSYQKYDMLVALNQDSINLDTKDLKTGGILLYDKDLIKILPNNSNQYINIGIPLGKMAREMGNALLRDTIILGVMTAIFEGDKKVMNQIINEEFKSRNEKILKQNMDASNLGFEYAVKNYKKIFLPLLKKIKKVDKKIVITGNEAAAIGAVAAGMQFAAIYPMTPITNILHTLAPLQNEYEFVFKQPEDEISAINMAIGASFAGVRSLVATAGGGYCLMTEGVGLAGMTETPIVIIEGMRGGPSTGLPTWTEQADLRFVLHSHQSEIPKIVLAPGDASEVYSYIFKAFNLSEKYQTPVVVMIDKQICESHESFEIFKNPESINRGKYSTKYLGEYSRYADSSDGISLRVPAGSGNHLVANSDEHNEKGFSNDDAENRDAMMKKRMRKMETCEKEDMEKPRLYGSSNADLTVVCWGSTKGAVLEAVKNFKNVNVLHINWILPFPADEVTRILKKCKRIVNIEGNSTAQMNGLIAELSGIRINDNILKFDGRPFFPEEISEEICKRIKL